VTDHSYLWDGIKNQLRMSVTSNRTTLAPISPPPNSASQLLLPRRGASWHAETVDATITSQGRYNHNIITSSNQENGGDECLVRRSLIAPSPFDVEVLNYKKNLQTQQSLNFYRYQTLQYHEEAGSRHRGQQSMDGGSVIRRAVPRNINSSLDDVVQPSDSDYFLWSTLSGKTRRPLPNKVLQYDEQR
jgi:hypothetical protein